MPRGRPNQGPRLVLIKRNGFREPIWYIRWSENRRTREHSTGTGDRRSADQIFARWLLERGCSIEEPKRRGPRRPADTAIDEVLSIYGAQHAPQLADPARIGYAIKHLLAWWGDLTVDAITPETCRQYRRERLRGGVKEATAAKELAVLRAALGHAVKNAHLISAPFVELPPKQPSRDRWLTRSEATRLLRESRREPRSRLHLPLFILIALYTGARRGAILELRWSQIDLVNGRIDFNQPGRPRTKKGRPIIPIPRGLRWFLRAAQQRANCPFVINYEGERVKGVRRSFDTACARAGLTGVTPHVLRHTCGTWLAQSGVDLHQIAGWLGHSNARTTELYAHHHPDHFAAAKRGIERRGR
jgi:integrase